jgi:hypothetical protein
MEPIIKGDCVYVPSEAMPGVPIGKQSIGRFIVLDGVWYRIYHVSTNTAGFMARQVDH